MFEKVMARLIEQTLEYLCGAEHTNLVFHPDQL
jgi:hypothetical protein